MKNVMLAAFYLMLVYLAWFAAQQHRLGPTHDQSTERNSFEYPTLD